MMESLAEKLKKLESIDIDWLLSLWPALLSQPEMVRLAEILSQVRGRHGLDEERTIGQDWVAADQLAVSQPGYHRLAVSPHDRRL